MCVRTFKPMNVLLAFYAIAAAAVATAYNTAAVYALWYVRDMVCCVRACVAMPVTEIWY